MFVLPPLFGVSANTLFIQSSDHHAAYDHIEDFVYSAFNEYNTFLRRDPNGRVVFIINGDQTGGSVWSGDRGKLALELIVELGQLPKAEIVITPGNHEAFDWMGREGNTLFVTQARFLRNKIPAREKPFAITVANVQPAPRYASLFQPHVDIKNGKATLRIVGLTLDRFFFVSFYDRECPVQVISEVERGLCAARRELELAAREGIGAVVFACHFDHHDAEILAGESQAWKSSLGAAAPALPIFFSAHGHEWFDGQVGDSRIFESGARYDFRTVEVDAEFVHVGGQKFTRETQKAQSHEQKLPRRIVTYLQRLKNYTRRVEKAQSRVLGVSAGYNDTRADMKRGRTVLGTTLADAFRAWGEKRAAADDRLQSLPVVALFNSSSYKRDKPIEAGEVTVGILHSVYPFAGSAGLYRISGQMIEKLFESFIATWGGRLPIPQMSSNLRYRGTRLEIRAPDGRWAALESDRIYLVALDSWLHHNGYKLRDWGEEFSRANFVAESPMAEILQREFLPRLIEAGPREIKRFSQIRFCENDLHRR